MAVEFSKHNRTRQSWPSRSETDRSIGIKLERTSAVRLYRGRYAFNRWEGKLWAYACDRCAWYSEPYIEGDTQASLAASDAAEDHDNWHRVSCAWCGATIKEADGSEGDWRRGYHKRDCPDCDKRIDREAAAQENY